MSLGSLVIPPPRDLNPPRKPGMHTGMRVVGILATLGLVCGIGFVMASGDNADHTAYGIIWAAISGITLLFWLMTLAVIDAIRAR